MREREHVLSCAIPEIKSLEEVRRIRGRRNVCCLVGYCWWAARLRPVAETSHVTLFIPRFQAPPRTASSNHLGLAQHDDGLGLAVVQGIADAPNRLLDSGLGQAFGVADGQILPPAVTVVDQGIVRVYHAGVQGLFDRFERQVRPQRVRHTLDHDSSGMGIDDDRHVDEPRPGRDVRHICKPQAVRALGLENPVHPVRGVWKRRHRHRRLHPPAPHHATKTNPRKSTVRPRSAPSRDPRSEAGATLFEPRTPGSSPPRDRCPREAECRDRHGPATACGPLREPCTSSTSTKRSAVPCRSARTRIALGALW